LPSTFRTTSDRESTNTANPDQTMSGSAATDPTKGEQKFNPDFEAKEMLETDPTWFQKRYGTKKDDKIVAGATGKVSKSDGSGQQKKPKKKSGPKCIAS